MKKYNYQNMVLAEIDPPLMDQSGTPVMLSDLTMQERRQKILSLMKKNQYDCLVIYNDLEHGFNFEYLTGFRTRFEEGLLILHKIGEAYLVLGNENIKMAHHSRITAHLIHSPYFSLPNQPMGNKENLTHMLEQSGLMKGMKTGLVGWKYFTSPVDDNSRLFDMPYFIVDSLSHIVGIEQLYNATDLFIHADYGARTTNNANEMAHYEFGSSLASDCVLSAMNAVEEGISELELGNHLNRFGQPNTVIAIAATGNRFKKANLYPSAKQVMLGDKISLTAGFKGGLASRAGYAVSNVSELPTEATDYIDAIAAPYFAAIVAWMENIRIGMSGDELYQLIEAVLPQKEYGWHLNPGHLTADEEWMSSPIYLKSDIRLKSGMLLQTDIIPSKKGYGGVGAESGIALADEALRCELSLKYPELWARILLRRSYVMEQLGIRLPEEVLPLSGMVGYFRPFMLNKSLAFVQRNG